LQHKPGRVAVFEIMINTPSIAALIRDNKTFRIQSDIQTGAKYGMVTLDSFLIDKYLAGMIAREEVVTKAQDPVTIQAKLGSMVAYQGEVKFERAGSGGMARLVKKMATGEGAKLMMVSGTGEVFLADHAQEIHLVRLADDKITVNSAKTSTPEGSRPASATSNAPRAAPATPPPRSRATCTAAARAPVTS